MADYKKTLTELYEKYNPAKLPEIDTLLTKYKGSEEELIESVKLKYGHTDIVKDEAEPESKEPVPEPTTQKEKPVEKNEPKQEAKPKPEPTSTTKKETPEPTIETSGGEGDFKTLLSNIYAKYNPPMLDKVDQMLEKYKGKEQLLLHALYRRYGIKNPDELGSRESNISSLSKDKSEQPKKEKVAEPAPEKDLNKSDSKAETQKDIKETAPKKEESKEDAVTEKIESKLDEAPKKKIEKPKSEQATQEPVKKSTSTEVSDPSSFEAKMKKEIHAKAKIEVERDLQEKKEWEESRRNELMAARKPKSSSSSSDNYSYKGLFVTLTVIAVVALIILIASPGFREGIANSFKSKDNPEVNNEDATDGERQSGGLLEKKKKKSIEPDIIRNSEEAVEEGNEIFETSDDEEDLKLGSEEADVDNNSTNEPAEQTSTSQDDNTDNASAGYVISYSAVSQESSAKNAVRELNAKGYDAGYYWIPDQQPDGKELYKVYIGPFNSSEQADASLENVRQMSAGAYVLYKK